MTNADKDVRAVGTSDSQGAEQMAQSQVTQSQVIQLKVDGMSCAHCVTAVDRALRAVPGVADVSVDLEAGRATVHGGADTAALTAAVAERPDPVPAAERLIQRRRSAERHRELYLRVSSRVQAGRREGAA